jgi:hypothetical protein
MHAHITSKTHDIIHNFIITKYTEKKTEKEH